MLRVMVKQARPGMTLARAVVNPKHPELTLLASGSVITAQQIARLHELGVFDCWVRYPGLDFLDDLFSPELTQQQTKMCDTLKATFTSQASRTENKLPVNQYREVVTGLIDAILNNARNMAFFSDLGAMDDAVLRHASEVAYLGVMLGLKLDGYLIEQRKRVSSHQAKEVVNLGIGCMLHDIGETLMPQDKRESRINWTQAHDPAADFSKEWREHVNQGYAKVRNQIEPTAAIIVLNHHQHYDGSGFPAGASGAAQTGEQIHVFARIATAADTFQHLLRPDGLALPTVIALHRIQQAPYRNWLDPVVLDAMLQVVPAFMPGMVVQLSDRRNAVVTKVSPETPCYPEVQILGDLDAAEDTSDREVVNLAAEEKLHIAAVDGVPVSEFLFGGRQGKRKLAAVA